MTPFEAFKLYLAVKNHFSLKSYDFFRYRGQVKVSAESFYSRPEKIYFDKLSRHNDLLGLLVSNCLTDNAKWAGDLCKPLAETNYKRWRAYNESLSYNFQKELGQLYPLDEFCRCPKGGIPALLVEYMGGRVSLETLVLLDKYLSLFELWDSNTDDTIMWPSIKNKAKKYTPFIKYDPTKITSAIKKTIVEHKAA